MLVHLKLALFQRGITQAVLATQIRETPARISRIIHGRLKPRASERIRIARVLGLPSWRLFPDVGRARLQRQKQARKQDHGRS